MAAALAIAASQSPPYMLCVFLFRVFYNFHALIMNNFKHRVLRIEPNNTAVQKCAISRSTQFAFDKKS